MLESIIVRLIKTLQTSTKPLIYFFYLCLLIAHSASHATAQSPPTTTVYPGLIEAEVNNLVGTQSAVFTVENGSEFELVYNLSLEQINENSGEFTPSGPLPDSLRSNLKLRENTLRIAPNTKMEAIVDISNSDSLSPGAHYAVLVIKQAGLGLIEESGVGLNPGVSLPIIFTKTDGAISELEFHLDNFKYDIFQFPTKIKITATNQGNVQLVPKAVARISRNPAELAIAQGVYNRDSKRLFPAKSLSETLELQKLGTIWLPGKYQLSVQSRFEGQDIFKEQYYDFYYIPPIFVVLSILIIVCLIRLTLRSLKLQKQRNKLKKERELRASKLKTPNSTNAVNVHHKSSKNR